MCGIAGVVGFGDERTTVRMRDRIAYRGPDSAGVVYFEDLKVGLGHRRLKIIDLSPAADQPMTQEDQSIWTVFNGEIYNFLELRRDLEQSGHRFKSKSDTEVILHLYEERGPHCFAGLNGIFAIALLDKPRRKLFLARDHVGVKPLYYYAKGGRLAFGSEIKAVLASGIYSPDLNRQALYDYLTYLFVPWPDTMFRDLFQVPPGHYAEFDLQSGDLQLRRFWRPQVSSPHHEPYQETQSKLRELLKDSVRRQMISDVPLGVFLSGGIDSPLLTGLMAQNSTRPVQSFTIVFQGKGFEYYNEQQQALAVAKRFHTEHHEIPVELHGGAEMLQTLGGFDQPFGNPTAYLMYLISKHTKPLATVALCGAGGDEMFAGYPRYRIAALMRRWHWAAGVLRFGAGPILNALSDSFENMKLRRMRRFFAGLDNDFSRQFVQWTYFFREDQKQELLVPNGVHLPSDRIVRKYLNEKPPDDLNRLLEVDLQTFLVDNILEYTDRASMAVALEVRVPFLDYRIVEYSLSIDFRHKMRGTETKKILKDTFSDLLPEEIRKAPKKGFNAPLAIWMRDDLDSYFDDQMSKPELARQGIFNWEYIQRLRHQHRNGHQDYSYELFSILLFDLWYKKHILQSVN